MMDRQIVSRGIKDDKVLNALRLIPRHFFAPALSHLEKIEKKSMSMAWALNGFASVAASHLAVLLSIPMGFIVPVIRSILLCMIAWLKFAHSMSVNNMEIY